MKQIKFKRLDQRNILYFVQLLTQEENLDSQQGVIDFSLYLRNKIDGEATAAKHSMSIKDEEGDKNMNAVLDQKNYVEELNRHLKYVSAVQYIDG